MAENNFMGTVDSLFKGMSNFISSKTVVGDAVRIDEKTIILPLVEVSFGVGAGAFAGHSYAPIPGGSHAHRGPGNPGGSSVRILPVRAGSYAVCWVNPWGWNAVCCPFPYSWGR